MGASVRKRLRAVHLSVVSGRSRISLWLWWLLLGPVLLLIGAWLGRELPRKPVWTEPPPSNVAAEQQRRIGIPSLAPIVRAARSGIVGIRTTRRGGAEPAKHDGALDLHEDNLVNGTGFIIHESGLVVTNHHLVVDHEQILVEVPGFRAVEAELVGDDPVTDVAVLRFDPPPGGVVALPLGDSTQVEQGDWVLAVGNPFEYSETVTVGIVSYVGRHIPEEGLLVSNEYLQFSAPVFPGSSGGPVLDMNGHVVGVTTSSHATGTGISFAVPSKVLKWVLERMDQAEGRVRRGFLGIQLMPVDESTCRALGLERGCGAKIGGVEEGCPADLAGLEVGDLVVSYNGKPVPDAYTLFDWITYSRPGDRAELGIVREGVRLPPLVARLGEVEYRAQPTHGLKTRPSD